PYETEPSAQSAQARYESGPLPSHQPPKVLLSAQKVQAPSQPAFGCTASAECVPWLAWGPSAVTVTLVGPMAVLACAAPAVIAVEVKAAPAIPIAAMSFFMELEP